MCWPCFSDDVSGCGLCLHEGKKFPSVGINFVVCLHLSLEG